MGYPILLKQSKEHFKNSLSKPTQLL